MDDGARRCGMRTGVDARSRAGRCESGPADDSGARKIPNVDSTTHKQDATLSRFTAGSKVAAFFISDGSNDSGGNKCTECDLECGSGNGSDHTAKESRLQQGTHTLARSTVASSCIIKFESQQNKRDFKVWLERNGGQVYSEKGLWFGDNVDREAKERERAVGKVKKALMSAWEGKKDVERDFRSGRVWAGRELVAQWNATSMKMQFRGTGKGIKVEYERMMAEERGVREEFSD